MHIKLILKTLNFVFALLLILAACAFAYIALPSFGNRALIVRSGSMKPAIGVGDLVVVRASENIASPVKSKIPKYKVGEIVAFKSGESIVTHRIADVKVEGGKVFYETKGDANKTSDKGFVKEENILGAEFVSVPKVGKIISFTKSNMGFPLLVIFPASLVIILESFSIFRELRKQKRLLQPQWPNPANLTSFKVLLPIFMTIFVFQSTFAYFSDTETSTNNIFTASSSFGSPSPSPSPIPSPSPSPTPPPIAETLVVNEFLWNSSCGQNDTQKALNYWIELYNGSSSTVDLKDWRFHDANNNTIQISNAVKLVDPGEYIIITKDGSVFTGCYTLQGSPETANLGGNENFLPLTTGGVIKLEQSIARNPNGVDSALGDTFAVSDFAVDSTISPGVAN